MALAMTPLAVSSPAVADSQTNSGSIDDSTAVSCGAAKCGLYSYTSPADLTNNDNGIIDITAGIGTYGLYAELSDSNSVATLSNSGSITTNGSGTGAFAYGLFAELVRAGSHATLSNSGSITATTTGPSSHVYGLHAVLYDANSTAELSNHGSITATSSIQIYGLLAILSKADSVATLSNHGSITATATNGAATGLNAALVGANSTATLSNSGSITATGTGAYGLIANLNGANSTAYLSNSGTIHVSGTSRAHQAYVIGAGSAGGTAHVTDWAMEWRDYSGDAGNQKPFAVESGATLDFSDGAGNGARLILTPATSGFISGKAYDVKDIYSKDGTSTVTGAIASVEGGLRFLQATLSGTDVSNQTIALTVDARQSDGQAVAVNTVATQHGMANRIGNILSAGASGASGASAGINSGDAADTLTGRGSLQFRPYYGYQSRRGLAAASTDAVGIAIVGTYETEDGHSFGAHAALEHSWLNNRAKTLETRSVAGLLGLHGRYNLTPAAYVRGQISGIVSSNNNEFRTIAGNSANTHTIGSSLYGAVFGGYDLRVDRRNTITPELGILALWSHTPAMDVQYNNPALDQAYAAQNYTAVYGNASLRWTGGFDIGGVMVKPTVMGGVRQTFTDGKIKSSLTYAGSRFESSITDDRTIGIAQIGASLPVAANTDLGLNYYGEYGKDTTNHMGYLNLKVRF